MYNLVTKVFWYFFENIYLAAHLVVMIPLFGFMILQQYITSILYTPAWPGAAYYKNPFGNIYIDTTKPCLGICAMEEFTYLPVRPALFKPVTFVPSYSRSGKAVNTDYAKDDTHVYFLEDLIPSADAPSFRALDYNLGQDNHDYYINNQSLLQKIADAPKPRAAPITRSATILSFPVSQYIIMRQDDSYYKIMLDTSPVVIIPISRKEAETYPPL